MANETVPDYSGMILSGPCFAPDGQLPPQWGKAVSCTEKAYGRELALANEIQSYLADKRSRRELPASGVEIVAPAKPSQAPNDRITSRILLTGCCGGLLVGLLRYRRAGGGSNPVRVEGSRSFKFLLGWHVSSFLDS